MFLNETAVQFIRFEMLTKNKNSGMPDGVFVAAYELAYGENPPIYHSVVLEELIDWFRKNLKKPTRLNRSNSKGAFRRN